MAKQEMWFRHNIGSYYTTMTISVYDGDELLFVDVEINDTQLPQIGLYTF